MSSKAKSYAFNSAWMLLEKLFRMLAAIITSVIFARYLGPSDFGNLNYVIAFVAIGLPIAEFGMSSILVRDIISNKKLKFQVLGTSFYLILIFSILVFLAINCIGYYVETNTVLKKWLFVYATIVLLKPFDVIDYYFQAEVKAIVPSACKTIAIVFSLALKITLVIYNAPILYIIMALVFEFLFLSILYLISFWKQENLLFFNFFDKTIFKDLLKSGWPLVLSALSVILYMRIDQIMLKNMASAKELGLYSAAIRLYEGYVSLIIVVSISMMPMVMALKKESESKYINSFTKLFSAVFWGNNLVALVMTFLGPMIIILLYGPSYEDAGTVFSIIFWASSLASFGSVSARYLIIEKLEKKQAIRTIIALLINVLLNILFIPRFGKEGAAVATIISLFIGNYLVDYFDKDLKLLLQMKNKAILFRYKL